MNAVYQFRLTGVLFHQIRRTGRSIAEVLANWDDDDYELLCDYVKKCKKIVPKYIKLIADLLDVSHGKIIKDIIGCRRGCSYSPNECSEEKNESYDYYSFGEDSVDLTLFIQQYCNEIKQYM